MHVKVGDTVKIISGHEKGKTGEITKIFKHNSTVIVKDINLKTKHMKSREEGEPGQIIKVLFFLRIESSTYVFTSCILLRINILIYPVPGRRSYPQLECDALLERKERSKSCGS